MKNSKYQIGQWLNFKIKNRVLHGKIVNKSYETILGVWQYRFSIKGFEAEIHIYTEDYLNRYIVIQTKTKSWRRSY